ncbi:substrate-binding domain-containing protein [Actinomadura sp. SCN-SB]|uniref:substrate-binding domain-containing protein n=1 Tax=Actinomadura sp. SCN-SB TaxID=3373092 RepID=UPI00375226F7
MPPSTEPQHRSIFWVDIAHSSDPRRSDIDRQDVRAAMYGSVRRAFRRARLPFHNFNNRFHRHQEDRGDGAFWLLWPSLPKSRLVDALPHLASALDAYNKNATEGTTIKLRVALHAGEVHFDTHGVSGNAMDYTARLLDAPEFKALFDESDSSLGVITSEWFHRSVIRQDPRYEPERYRRLAVSVRDAGEGEALVRFFTHAEATAVRRAVPSLPWWPATPPRPVRAAAALAAVAVPLAVAPGENTPATCDNPPVQIRVRVSAEKEALIRDLALRFEDDTRDADGCRMADVNVVAGSYPGGAREALRQGWLTRDPREMLDEADVWLPDSSLEVEQVREALRENRIGTVRLEAERSITTSRLVLAVPARMARELSLSGSTTTWKDALTWPGRGYAFGRAAPRSSSTGLAATVALYQAALGQKVLNEAALTRGDAAGRLHAVEQSIAREEDEPGKLLCAMRGSSQSDAQGTIPPPAGAPQTGAPETGAPQTGVPQIGTAPRQDARTAGDLRRTALFVSEKSLIDYHFGAPLGGGEAGGACGDPSRQPELLPFYAEDGMPELDHPFVVITRTPPPAPSRRRIIDAFQAYLLRPEARERFKEQGYRDDTGNTTTRWDAIPSVVGAVNLAGRYHDGPLLDAWNKARKSAQVLFAVDVSERMAAPFPYIKGTRVAAAADAIGLARRLMGARDQIGLWRFAEDVDRRSLVPVGPPDSGRIADLTRRLEGLRPSEGEPDLYAAIRAAVREMRSRGGTAPDETTRAVIVLAHGADAGGDASEAAALADDLSTGTPVRLYVIAFHPESCAAGLDQVTQAAGGACYEIDGMTTMRRALDGIAAGLWGTPP